MAHAGQAPAVPLKLTLSHALELALKHNLSLKAKEAEIAFAQGRRLAAFQSVLPTVTGTASYQRNIMKPVLFFPNSRTGQVDKIELGEDNVYDFQARATQPVFDFGGMYFALKRAGLAYEASKSLVEDTRNAIVYETTLSYYELHYLEENAALQGGMADKSETALAQTRAKRKQGLASAYDVLAAEAANAEGKAVALAAEQARERGYSRLRTLLDLPAATAIALESSLELPAPPPAFEALMDDALARNPFLKHLKLNTQSLKTALSYERTHWAPRLDGQFAYGLEGQSDSSFPDDSEFAESMNAGVTLSVPFFDGLRREGEIKQAKATYVKALYEMKASTRDFRDELEKAYQNALLARARYEAGLAQEAAAREAHRGAQLRRGQGLVTALDLTALDLSFRAARAARMQAEWNVIAAATYLDRLKGYSHGSQ